MTTHFIFIGQILWWQARRVLRVYYSKQLNSNNAHKSVFITVRAFLVYVALLSWVIFIKNTDKSLYTPTLLVFILEQMVLYYKK